MSTLILSTSVFSADNTWNATLNWKPGNQREESQQLPSRVLFVFLCVCVCVNLKAGEFDFYNCEFPSMNTNSNFWTQIENW